jgi:hypothetical protein
MSNILFIFEGEKTEQKITENLTKYFINEHKNTIVTCAYCAEIYQLYNEISQDIDLDTFTLLKRRPANEITLEPYSRNDFAEIYMFFDYDGHSTLANDEKIEELLTVFNEETEKGKLYINYPMVESLKHINIEQNFKDSTVSAKENIKYKRLVDSEAENNYKQINSYTKEIWIELIELHIKKANFIINNDYLIPESNLTQYLIFKSQFEKYIKINNSIAVLNSFPLFLLDYYGINFISNLLRK